MTQEEKQLLLKDLSARLPYKPMIRLDFQPGHGYQEGKMEIRNFENIIRHFENGIIATIKPYLRPMSSMTEEEKEDVKPLFKLVWTDDNKRLLVVRQNKMAEYLDYIYSHHFDFRGLIEKSLAMEAPEGMYKTE